MDIRIRRVIPGEARAMSEIALAAKSHWGYPERWIRLWVPELTFSPSYFEDNESWAAVIADQVAGFYTLQEKDSNAWLENLWIKPEFMGRGLGKALFAHAVELSRQRGYRQLRWESDPNALGFYERMGARKTGERHSEVDGQPRILPIMELDL